VDEPDPRLIRAAAGGDHDAFSQLVRAWQVPVVRYLERLLGDRTSAEDVAQEAFLRCYVHLGRYTFEGKFSTWLISIAHNAGIDAVRKRARGERATARLPPPRPSSDPATRVDPHHWADAVRRRGWVLQQQPEAELMGVFGAVALAVNLAAAAALIPHRSGDASARAIWLFSRNDALANLAVVIAAGLVAWSGTPWPDLVVAVMIAALFLQSSWSIIRDARADIADAHGGEQLP